MANGENIFKKTAKYTFKQQMGIRFYLDDVGSVKFKD